jgi:hypothetical protein
MKEARHDPSGSFGVRLQTPQKGGRIEKIRGNDGLDTLLDTRVYNVVQPFYRPGGRLFCP